MITSPSINLLENLFKQHSKEGIDMRYEETKV